MASRLPTRDLVHMEGRGEVLYTWEIRIHSPQTDCSYLQIFLGGADRPIYNWPISRYHLRRFAKDILKYG